MKGKRMSKKTYGTEQVLFKFKCLDCNKVVEVNIYEVLEVGHPICCDEEMEINDRCVLT